MNFEALSQIPACYIYIHLWSNRKYVIFQNIESFVKWTHQHYPCLIITILIYIRSPQHYGIFTINQTLQVLEIPSQSRHLSPRAFGVIGMHTRILLIAPILSGTWEAFTRVEHSSPQDTHTFVHEPLNFIGSSTLYKLCWCLETFFKCLRRSVLRERYKDNNSKSWIL